MKYLKGFPHRQPDARDDGLLIGCLPVAVDDDDLVIERGAKAGVLPAVHPDVGTHAIAALDVDPPVTKPGPVGGHTAAHNGDQASARFESEEGLLDVAGSKRRAVSCNAAAGGRKRRVHDDGMVRVFRRKKIIEAFGVERRGLESLLGQ